MISRLYLRRGARRTDKRGSRRKQNGFRNNVELTDDVASGQSWKIKINRTGDMVLDPLTDIGLRMFVTIRIGSGQLVVDILSHGERSQTQDDTDHPQRHPKAE